MKKIIFLFLFNFLLFPNFCLANEPNESAQISSVIEKLNQTAGNLKNFTSKIEYTHLQPLFETQTIRTGKVFYVKEVNFCALRINFTTMKQEDAPEQKYREDYIFDGWKMTKIDYQGKSAVSEPLAKEKPIEPFELVQGYFPIIGLARPAEMEEQFDIKILENKNDLISLCLKPKEAGGFSKTYKEIEIKIDPKNFIPFDFSAVTSEDEKIRIYLSKIDTKNQLKKNIFEADIPKDFSVSQKSADSNDN